MNNYRVYKANSKYLSKALKIFCSIDAAIKILRVNQCRKLKTLYHCLTLYQQIIIPANLFRVLFPFKYTLKRYTVSLYSEMFSVYGHDGILL